MQPATHHTPAPLGAIHATAPSQPGRNLKTFPQFCRDNPAFTEGGLRWVRFCSIPGRFDSTGKPIAMNGFSDAFVNVGRRVYVDEDRFFEILRAQNEKGAA
jgi:hypothetical protein